MTYSAQRMMITQVSWVVVEACGQALPGHASNRKCKCAEDNSTQVIGHASCLGSVSARKCIRERAVAARWL